MISAPYAAKAIIQHEFVIDTLKIWITFRLPMTLTENAGYGNPRTVVKPPDSKWIVKLENIETAITSSEWPTSTRCF